MKTKVVVAWHDPEQKEKFCDAWEVDKGETLVHFEQDKDKSGCAKTKNRAIAAVLEQKPDVIIVLDDDCFPVDGCHPNPLAKFVTAHLEALEPQSVHMFEAVTLPPSRGTPYFERTIRMPVAASMGFWTDIGDYDAPGQLIHGAETPMRFRADAIYGKYFAFSGMNFAFRSHWAYCARLIEDVGRFDDIWMGLFWQKMAYQKGHCFSLNGPCVRHSRQSNVFSNLRDEAPYLERNETLWKRIHAAPAGYSYDELRRNFQL